MPCAARSFVVLRSPETNRSHLLARIRFASPGGNESGYPYPVLRRAYNIAPPNALKSLRRMALHTAYTLLGWRVSRPDTSA